MLQLKDFRLLGNALTKGIVSLKHQLAAKDELLQTVHSSRVTYHNFTKNTVNLIRPIYF